MRPFRLALTVAACLWLAGCDQLGIESASALASKREAEGKAVGGACRHAARSIEQCYDQNKRADKAAVFSGWREMNDYMRENKLEAMPAVTSLVADGAADTAADEVAAPQVAAKMAKDTKPAPVSESKSIKPAKHGG